jgi:hypothetical protein
MGAWSFDSRAQAFAKVIVLVNLRSVEAGCSSRKNRQQGGNSTIPSYVIQDRDGPELRDW